MSNPKQLWDSMKSITNMHPSRNSVSVLDDLQKANDVNNVYLRFERCGHISENSTSETVMRTRSIIILNTFAPRNRQALMN